MRISSPTSIRPSGPSTVIVRIGSSLLPMRTTWPPRLIDSSRHPTRQAIPR